MCNGDVAFGKDGDGVHRCCSFDAKVALVQRIVDLIFGNGVVNNGALGSEFNGSACRLADVVAQRAAIRGSHGTGEHLCGSVPFVCKYSSHGGESFTTEYLERACVSCGQRVCVCAGRCGSYGGQYGDFVSAGVGGNDLLGSECERGTKLSSSEGRFRCQCRCGGLHCGSFERADGACGGAQGGDSFRETAAYTEGRASGVSAAKSGENVGAVSTQAVGQSSTDDSAGVSRETTVVESVPTVHEFVKRGKHWAKNKARREAAKQEKVRERVRAESLPEWRRKDASRGVHVGVFSECSEDVRAQLRDSRAMMLVAKNNLETARAVSAKKRADAEQVSRLDEVRFELDRFKLEKERADAVEKHLATLPSGYAETLASAGIESGLGSFFLEGSVSPSSSVSMAEVQAMQREISNLKEQVAFDAAEFAEEKVKWQARLAMLKEANVEAVAAEKAKYDELNRMVSSGFGVPKPHGTRIYGGNGYSSWSK